MTKERASVGTIIFTDSDYFQPKQNTLLTRLASFSKGFKYFVISPWKNCTSDSGSCPCCPSPVLVLEKIGNFYFVSFRY